MMEIIGWIIANGPNMLSALIAILSAIIALCLIIPGDQPEKFLQAVVDFLKLISKK